MAMSDETGLYVCRGFWETPALSWPLSRVSNVMFASWTNLMKSLRMGRWCWGAVLAFCLASMGCCNMDLCGGSLREDDLSAMPKQLRPAERNNEAFGFSNKAKQIERNFGYQ